MPKLQLEIVQDEQKQDPLNQPQELLKLLLEKAKDLDRKLHTHFNVKSGFDNFRNSPQHYEIIESLQQEIDTVQKAYINLNSAFPQIVAIATHLIACREALQSMLDIYPSPLDEMFQKMLNISPSSLETAWGQVSQSASKLVYSGWQFKYALEKEINALAAQLNNPTINPLSESFCNPISSTVKFSLFDDLPSFDNSPNVIRLLILSYLDLKDFASLKTTTKNNHALVRAFFSEPKLKDILDISESLLSSKRKSKEEIIHDNKTITALGDWLNRKGIVSKWANNNDDASQLAYALTTEDVNKVDWENKIIPLLKRGNSRWPHIIASVQKAKYLVFLAKKFPSSIDQTNVNVTYVNMKKVDLNHLELIDTPILQFTDLRNTNLSNTKLERSNLTYANLTNANLNNANLRNAVLNNANLTNTNVSNTHLAGTNLSNANITGADFRNSTFFYLANKELITQISANNIILDLKDIENATSLDELIKIEDYLFPYKKERYVEWFPINWYKGVPEVVLLIKALQNKTKTVTGLSRAMMPFTAWLIKKTLQQSKITNDRKDIVFSTFPNYKLILSYIEWHFLRIFFMLPDTKKVVNLLSDKIQSMKIAKTNVYPKSDDPDILLEVLSQVIWKDEAKIRLALKQIYRLVFEASLPPAAPYLQLLWANCLTYIEMTYPEFDHPPQNKGITWEETDSLIAAHNTFKENRLLSFFRGPDSQHVRDIKKMLVRKDLTDMQRYQVLWFYMFEPGNHGDDFYKVIQQELTKTKEENFFKNEEANSLDAALAESRIFQMSNE
ncbi:MAG: pentapeptide repeat-containing protein [Gammaproteobacteria bacterium]